MYNYKCRILQKCAEKMMQNVYHADTYCNINTADLEGQHVTEVYLPK